MFCSTDCHDSYQGRNKISYTCKICGVLFKKSPYARKLPYPVTYCSWACRDADPAKHQQLLRMNEDQMLKRPTRAEVAGYALLDSLGLDYIRQARFAGKFTPDAAVPASRLIVQFDGDYWHDRRGTSTEARIRRRVSNDRAQDAYIVACGWRVLRLWESDLLKAPDACAAKIKPLLPLRDGYCAAE
jgi:DNA mismatch endonuclease (patch repair protein)